MIIKFDKSIFTQFLHMINWQKNRNNFENESRNHFFQKCFYFWLLTSYEIILHMDKTYALCTSIKIKNKNKNRKNFEKRSRKHFFNEVISFWKNVHFFKMLLLDVDLLHLHAELSGIGHRVYGLSSANDFPFIFVHFRGVFPYFYYLQA